MRRPRSVLSGLPARVGMIMVVASLPLLSLAIIDHRSAGGVVVAIAAGVTIGVVGIDLVVARPLRHVRRSVLAWRAGEPFEVHSRAGLPLELHGLALSFKRATSALARREAQLRIANQQQELAMQEIHHRVKNNLQIVASLLNLQSSRIRLPEARAEFQSARDRVRALATLHRHLYAHGGVHSINMRLFLLELCGQLFQAMGETEGERLTLVVEAPELEMSSDQAVPLSLIVTETVSNAIKYAYPAGRRGTIAVRLSRNADAVELEVCDDGIGIPAGRAETDGGTRDGIGLKLVTGFARQLGATLDIQQGAGTRYLVGMTLRRERLQSPLLRVDGAAAAAGP